MGAMTAMKSTKAMKAMKAMKKRWNPTKAQWDAQREFVMYVHVCEAAGGFLIPKEAKAAVEGLLILAAAQAKKNGSFKVADMFVLKAKTNKHGSCKLKINVLKKIKDMLQDTTNHPLLSALPYS